MIIDELSHYKGNAISDKHNVMNVECNRASDKLTVISIRVV